VLDLCSEIEALLGPDRESFVSGYPVNVRATTDDWPYFFYCHKPSLFIGELSEQERLISVHEGVFAAPRILAILFVSVLGMTALTAHASPFVMGRLRFGGARRAGFRLVYFAGIGLGFILVEIAFMQRFALLLGQPLYAFSVVLATMLVASGIGSLLSHRVAAENLLRSVRIALGAVVIGIIVHASVAQTMIEWGMRQPLWARLVLTVVTVAPLALVMGVALPCGMRLLDHAHRPARAWAWSVNGSLSVFGSVLAMIVAIFAGISAVLELAAGAYLVACLTPWAAGLRSSTQRPSVTV
jgi:hypothetical protein